MKGQKQVMKRQKEVMKRQKEVMKRQIEKQKKAKTGWERERHIKRERAKNIKIKIT